MTVEIDETTGLPVLPDGDFWRVTPFATTSLMVQLRRDRWLLGSVLVGSEIALVGSRQWGTPEAQVLEAANKVMRRPDVSHLVGDYPPKRLQP